MTLICRRAESMICTSTRSTLVRDELQRNERNERNKREEKEKRVWMEEVEVHVNTDIIRTGPRYVIISISYVEY